MKDRLSLTQGLRDTEYGQYRDTVADWQTDRNYAQSAYDSEYNRDYAAWMDMLSYWQTLAGQENSNYWNQMNYDFEMMKYLDSLKKSGGSGGGSGRTSPSNTAPGSPPYNKNLLAVIAADQAGGTPTAQQLAKAGVSQETWNEFKAGTSAPASTRIQQNTVPATIEYAANQLSKKWFEESRKAYEAEKLKSTQDIYPNDEQKKKRLLEPSRTGASPIFSRKDAFTKSMGRSPAIIKCRPLYATGCDRAARPRCPTFPESRSSFRRSDKRGRFSPRSAPPPCFRLSH